MAKDSLREYRTWSGIKQRCLNPKSSSYKNYGGRGIFICDEWKNSFEQFFIDMGPKPEGMSIDRIDNNSGYRKDNCRWATQSQQCRNKSRLSKETIRIRDERNTKIIDEFLDEREALKRMNKPTTYTRIAFETSKQIKVALIRHCEDTNQTITEYMNSLIEKTIIRSLARKLKQ